MLHFAILATLLTAASAQQSYYCNSSSLITITDSDFYVVTRRGPSEAGYPQGLTCQFRTAFAGQYFLEFQSFSMINAILTVYANSRILFSGSNLPKYQSSISMDMMSQLSIQFNAAGDYSNSRGAVIRVRVFQPNRCPPGWVFFSSTCFGTGTTSGQLNFYDAQRACNSMRSNLLQLPPTYTSSISSFLRNLPSSLKQTYTWVGLTDMTSYGQYSYYWLNGQRQIFTSEISCVSGGSARSCYSYERCGGFSETFLYSVYMSSCTTSRYYACSMPPGGTDQFYAVPSGGVVISINYLALGISLGSLFVSALIVGGVYALLSANRRRRAQQAGCIVTQPPPPGTYPAQYQYGATTQYPPPQPYGIQSPPPPAYPADAYACDGHGGINNGGYSNK